MGFSLNSRLQLLHLSFIIFVNANPNVDADCRRDGMNCVDPLSKSVETHLMNSMSQTSSTESDPYETEEKSSNPSTASPDFAWRDFLPSSSATEAQVEASRYNAEFGLNIEDCIKDLETAISAYKTTEAKIYNLKLQITESESDSASARDVGQEINSKSSAFEPELERLYGMYNDVASRANVLGKWMIDEKEVRDHLSSVFRILDVKGVEQAADLELMKRTLNAALHKMSAIHHHVGLVLTAVANAESAMYSWALNVTSKVNSQTAKVVNLAQGMEYRLTQIENAEIEMARMANLLLMLARHFGDGDLSDAAEQLIIYSSEDTRAKSKEMFEKRKPEKSAMTTELGSDFSILKDKTTIANT